MAVNTDLMLEHAIPGTNVAQLGTTVHDVPPVVEMGVEMEQAMNDGTVPGGSPGAGWDRDGRIRDGDEGSRNRSRSPV